MRATFKNRLEQIKKYDGMPRIAFDHGVPCGLKFFIEKTKPATTGHNMPTIDWKIVIEGGDDETIAKYKKELYTSLNDYITRRTKTALDKTPFKTLESLATMRSV